MHKFPILSFSLICLSPEWIPNSLNTLAVNNSWLLQTRINTNNCPIKIMDSDMRINTLWTDSLNCVWRTVDKLLFPTRFISSPDRFASHYAWVLSDKLLLVLIQQFANRYVIPQYFSCPEPKLVKDQSHGNTNLWCGAKRLLTLGTKIPWNESGKLYMYT